MSQDEASRCFLKLVGYLIASAVRRMQHSDDALAQCGLRAGIANTATPGWLGEQNLGNFQRIKASQGPFQLWPALLTVHQARRCWRGPSSKPSAGKTGGNWWELVRIGGN